MRGNNSSPPGEDQTHYSSKLNLVIDLITIKPLFTKLCFIQRMVIIVVHSVRIKLTIQANLTS